MSARLSEECDVVENDDPEVSGAPRSWVIDAGHPAGAVATAGVGSLTIAPEARGVVIRLGHRAARLRSDLQNTLRDAFAWGLMVGLGETYLVAFALAIGIRETLAGLLSTVPMLLGALLQLVSPWAIERIGSQRRWILICASIQATALLILSIAAVTGVISLWSMVLIAAMYWGAGYATGPAWTTWITTIVPSRIRTRFFAGRSRFAQVAILLGLLVSAIELQNGRANGIEVLVFAALFFAAACFRFAGVGFLARQGEPEPLPKGYRRISGSDFLRRFAHGRDGRLLAYMLAFQVSVQISGPFFTPYILQKLDYSYVEWLALVTVSFVAKFAAMPMLGRFAKRVGAQGLLWLGGVGVIPLPAFWILSDNIVYLGVLMAAAGVSWGAYELATVLLMFDRITPAERTSVLTWFNLVSAIAIVGGSLVGGALLSGLGETSGAYHIVFVASTVMRFGVLLLLRRVVALHERPGAIDFHAVATRVLAVRPSMGSFDTPLLRANGTSGRADAGGTANDAGPAHDDPDAGYVEDPAIPPADLPPSGNSRFEEEGPSGDRA